MRVLLYFLLAQAVARAGVKVWQLSTHSYPIKRYQWRKDHGFLVLYNAVWVCVIAFMLWGKP